MRVRSAPGINLTPMIDVSFLLIIFFIVSSHLAQQEVRQELPLPLAESGSPAIPSDERRVVINVDEAGELTIGAEPLAESDLQERLAAAKARAEGDLEVRIRSARSAPYRQIEPILLACSRAGIWKVTFAVYRRGEGN